MTDREKASNELPRCLCSNCQWHVLCLLGVKLLLCPLDVCLSWQGHGRWGLTLHVPTCFQFRMGFNSLSLSQMRNSSSVKSLLWLKKCSVASLMVIQSRVISWVTSMTLITEMVQSWHVSTLEMNPYIRHEGGAQHSKATGTMNCSSRSMKEQSAILCSSNIRCSFTHHGSHTEQLCGRGHMMDWSLPHVRTEEAYGVAEH